MVDTCLTCGQPLPPDHGTLANLIRARRLALKMTLRDVERVTGGIISNPYLSQLETGKVRDPSARMLLAVSAALGLDIDELLRAVDYLRYCAAKQGETARV